MSLHHQRIHHRLQTPGNVDSIGDHCGSIFPASLLYDVDSMAWGKQILDGDFRCGWNELSGYKFCARVTCLRWSISAQVSVPLYVLMLCAEPSTSVNVDRLIPCIRILVPTERKLHVGVVRPGLLDEAR